MPHSVGVGRDALRHLLRDSAKVTAVLKKPGELVFLNPTLAAGNYRLEVRSRMATIGPVRIGALQEPLTVL